MSNRIIDKNKVRESRSEITVEYYKHKLLKEAGKVCEDDYTDLLADMLHDLGEEQFTRLSNRAKDHYHAELNGED